MPETPGTILEVKNLNVAFDGSHILSDVSFSVAKGEVLAIVGPNGAGKSTLFRALLGLVDYQGSVAWQPGIRLGYVPQKLSIEPGIPITVREFLGLKTKSLQKIREALGHVGIRSDQVHEHHFQHHLLNRQLRLLSGGELQRVLIAWALVDTPDVLLFDEPTAGIDIGGEKTIYNLLHDLQDQRNLTILLISHDLNVVYRNATNVLCLNRRQICYGEPREVMGSESMRKLYGNDVGLYHHTHNHTRHEH